MKEDDVLKLIEAEQRRRRAADAGHMRRLSREVGGDLGAWCSARRHAVRAAAMALLVLLPGTLFMLLPQRTDDRQVLCNLRGEEQLVLNRACSAVGNCTNALVSNMMNGVGDGLNHK